MIETVIIDALAGFGAFQSGLHARVFYDKQRYYVSEKRRQRELEAFELAKEALSYRTWKLEEELDVGLSLDTKEWLSNRINFDEIQFPVSVHPSSKSLALNDTNCTIDVKCIICGKRFKPSDEYENLYMLPISERKLRQRACSKHIVFALDKWKRQQEVENYGN